MRLLNPDGTASSLVIGGQGRERNLVANTLSARYHKDGSENLIMVGRLEGADLPSNRVYSPEGASPALTTPSGGRHMPKIVVLDMFNKRMRRDGLAGTLKGEGVSNTSLGTVLAVKGDLASFRNPRRQHGIDGEAMFTLRGAVRHLAIFRDHTKGEHKGQGRDASESTAWSLGGSETVIGEKESPFDGLRIRRLTPRECARLQGFPDSFVIPVSDTQAYKQFGNAVTVPVVEAIGRKVEEYMRRVGLL